MITGAILGAQFGGLGFMFMSYMMWQQRLIKPEQAIVVMLLAGAVMLITGFISFVIDHRKGTAKIKDTPQPGRLLALHIGRGGAVAPEWATRNAQGQMGIQNKGLFRDTGEGALNFCGHPTRIVYETIGVSLDPEMVIAINELIEKYGCETIWQARQMAEIVARHEKDADTAALERDLKTAGFNPTSFLQDRLYNTWLGTLVDTYFKMREFYASRGTLPAGLQHGKGVDA